MEGLTAVPRFSIGARLVPSWDTYPEYDDLAVGAVSFFRLEEWHE